MTDREKEIRAIEQKILAKARRIRLKESKKVEAMTPEERQEYYQKEAEALRARGINVI